LKVKQRSIWSSEGWLLHKGQEPSMITQLIGQSLPARTQSHSPWAKQAGHTRFSQESRSSGKRWDRSKVKL